MAWRRGQAYGQDLRDRVLACPDLTLVEAATRSDVSPSYVSKMRARLRGPGDAAPGPQHNHVPLRLALLTDVVRFSELKRLLRDAAERTVEALWQTIGRLLEQSSPQECANYIRHCGLAQSGR